MPYHPFGSLFAGTNAAGHRFIAKTEVEAQRKEKLHTAPKRRGKKDRVTKSSLKHQIRELEKTIKKKDKEFEKYKKEQDGLISKLKKEIGRHRGNAKELHLRLRR